MKHIPCISFILLSLLLALCCLAAPAQAEKVVLFEGTQYPLEVYFISGEEPGPTVMVQGGIQGDEPAGFITSQLLTKAKVRKGNLVVVPRANVPSIHAGKRQINVDLNRRFDKNYNKFYEDRLARAIRFLMAGCDAFLHLHEGSGFYHPTYVDAWRNPNRYGQSIIIDTTSYQGRINLADAVQQVLPRLNMDLVPAQYRFQLFNTNTFDPATQHPEQRKSLTYYALSGLNIPALAIEVSKNIDTLDWKVRQQLFATELFLAHFGVEVETPEYDDAEVVESGEPLAMLMVNGRPVTLRTGESITLAPCSLIEPVVAEPGPDRMIPPAWSVVASDREKLNILDSPRLALSPFDSLITRADGKPQKTLPVQWKGEWPQAPDGDRLMFVCWLNDTLHFVPEGGSLETVRGDRLVLEGVWGGKRDEVINVKGYVSSPGDNDGQDMGVEIVLEPDNFLGKYFLPDDNPDEWLVRIARETPGAERVDFTLRIAERKAMALRLTDSSGQPVTVQWDPGAPYALPSGEYSLDGVLTNGAEDMIQPTLGPRPLVWGDHIEILPGEPVQLTLRYATTFSPIDSMVLTAPDS